jgi:hypothetical protein
MAGEGTQEVGPAVWLDAAAIPVFDPGQLPALAFVGVNDDMFVPQHADAQVLQLWQPFAQARIVLVVARNHEDALTRTQAR